MCWQRFFVVCEFSPPRGPPMVTIGRMAAVTGVAVFSVNREEGSSCFILLLCTVRIVLLQILFLTILVISLKQVNHFSGAY